MPKVSPIQTAFNAGEFSPLMYGRVDYDKYRRGLAVSLNGVPLVQGPWARRPGTAHVAETKSSASASRLLRFQFSTTQAYVLEFGNLYMRVFKDHAQVVTAPDTPFELVTPYATADLAGLQTEQSADVLYVVHASHLPYKITRTGHTSWTATPVGFVDGPYLPTNTTATTLSPASASGTGITVTASSVTGINGGAGFRASDVNRWMRIKHSTTWGWAFITAVTDTTHAVVSITSAFGGTGAVTDWRLGLYNATDGWPTAVAFHDDRLGFGGAGGAPSRFDFSNTGAYETFSPTASDGVIADDNAIAYSLNGGDVQLIRWMASEEKGLVVGTSSAEWVVRPSSLGEALSPTNVDAKRVSKRGSRANVPPLTLTNSVLYVQKSGRKLREIAYNIEVDGFRSPDMTVLSEHVTLGGIKELAYQAEPHSVVWGVRNDGVLLSFTYDREQDVLAWGRHILGGYSNAGRTVDAKVESVTAIPAPDGTYDEVWMIVNRYVNGGTERNVEYMTKFREEGDAQEDAFFVDSGLTYDGSAATTISGLEHLEGETVSILADGAVHPTRVVDDGEITLTHAASVVQVGLAYNSDGQMLRIEAGAADGTAQGKTQRSHRVVFRLHESGPVKVGEDFDNLTPLNVRTSSHATGAAVPLFTGDKGTTWEGDYSSNNYICWRFDQPLPGTVVGIMPQLHTQDR